MAENKGIKRRLMAAVLALVMCLSSFVGTTFAWFTDTVTSAGNVIQAGTLKVDLAHKVGDGWVSVKDNSDHKIFNYDKWEPGFTAVETLKVKNLGTLALRWRLSVTVEYGSAILGENGENLADVIDVYVTDGDAAATDFATVRDTWTCKGALSDVLQNPSSFLDGKLTAENAAEGEKTISIALHMRQTAGNEYQNLSVGNLYVTLVATQVGSESDSFGPDYDADATFPDLNAGDVAVDVTVQNGVVTEKAEVQGTGIAATVPAGVTVEAGVGKLGLSVTELVQSEANLTLNDGEALRSLDVHMTGVAKNNTVPLQITVEKAMKAGLNIGNYTLYHVENGAPVPMTAVASMAELDAHNEYYYDPTTGDVILSMATFSEVDLVADTENAWEGKFDYTWYDASKTELIIANADQLAAFGAIVGGMKKVTDRVDNKYTYSEEVIQDSFEGKTVKLVADINLGDKESENNPNLIFYPIGYWNNEGTYERKPLEERTTAVKSGLYSFCGTFDGNGHTISNFYQNTWEMKGDHDWYNTITEQYYRDGMGLFGRVYKGTVKNLTVENFSSDGEIATTGVIAAYADGATFENIAIFNCNPRVYNIGNGGIVGCVGWYAKEAGLTTTFKNITVDNSNKISALWGSYDVACGGIVGQYYPTSGQSSANYPVNAGIYFENCHVSAQMDVYNDVCANYQYYAYRYTGMLIGSVRENETIDGHVYPKMDGITAKNCTVHFGTWNDYYYCEIIDNTTASYTHDYQMSRLTEIKAIDGTTITYLDGTTGTVPASGRANYVIVDYSKGHGTENATCYHFKDGAVWTHDMGGIQTGIDENGDGQDDLKEDKQHIYLEFNNLVTGYGWGVTTKGVGDLAGVTILDREVANSVEKFEGKVTELVNNKVYKLGDIFTFVDKGVELVPGALTVTVTNLGENNPVSATIVYDRDNWENGTITFTGVGEITVTIQDYYFCTPTTITVNVTERQNAEKFDLVFKNTEKYLYRVGNQNAVSLSSLFKAKDGVTVGTVSVTVEAVNGTSASGTYSSNEIQFSGTGVVKVTVKDDDTYCIPTELYLEVVDAVNATGATDATANNVVLLNDISGGFTVSNGYAFYGNGFKVTCSGKGTYLNNGGLTRGYVNVENGGLLDNTQVVCDIYPFAFVYASEVKVNSNLDTEASTQDRLRYMYQLSAIAVSGNGSVVSNCYAYGGRNNIYVGGGNVKIENTVTECGTLANVQIKSSSEYTVVLKDVITEQYQTKSPYDDTKNILGFGILVGDNESESNPTLCIQGSLTQYNWVTEADLNISNDYAKQAIEAALNTKEYQHTYNGGTTVNAGIIFLNSKARTIDDSRKNHGYKGQTVTVTLEDPTTGMSGKSNVYVYSLGSSSGNYATNKDDYIASTQGDVRPTIEFNLGTQAVSGEDRYLKGDINGLEARYEKGQEAFTLDITKLLSASKHGIKLEVTASCIDPGGIEHNNKVTLSKAGTYTLKFIVEDHVSFNATGELFTTTVEREYTVSLEVTIAEPAIKDATIEIKTQEWSGKYTDASADGSKNLSFNLLEGVAVTDNGSTFNLKGNGGTAEITYSATSGGYGNAFGGVTTIKITYEGGQVLTVKIKKISGNVPGDPKTISYDVSTGTVKSNKQIAKNSCTAQTWNAYEYSFKGLNGKTITSDAVVTITVAKDTTCITPDTLITLADGTQVRVDALTGKEELLVWNMATGKLDKAPILFIDSDPEAEFEIVHLYFSDGTDVKVIYEHGFWDYDLNRYVYLDGNAAKYIGHTFAKQNGDVLAKVELVDVVIETEVTTAYSPVTAGHLCYFVNGMLSMPGGVGGLFNIFEVDAETMTYDEEAMRKDIETYGLYTYEELNAICPLSEEMFHAAGGAYLKISIGKGNLTEEELFAMIHRYSKFFD